MFFAGQVVLLTMHPHEFFQIAVPAEFAMRGTNL